VPGLGARIVAAPKPEQRAQNVSSPEEMAALEFDWSFWGRLKQYAPAGNWSNWLILAGRGFGKTRTGAEWVRQNMCGDTPLTGGRWRYIAIIAETAANAATSWWAMAKSPPTRLPVPPQPPHTRALLRQFGRHLPLMTVDEHEEIQMLIRRLRRFRPSNLTTPHHLTTTRRLLCHRTRRQLCRSTGWSEQEEQTQSHPGYPNPLNLRRYYAAPRKYGR
jgi:hypothetical protein